MKTESTHCRGRLRALARSILKSHPLACVTVALGLLLAAVAASLLVARLRAATDSSDTAQNASALFAQGELQKAQALFAAVPPSDPAYSEACAYDALCRYQICRAAQTNDYRWFFDALKSPALQDPSVPKELREELAFAEIDARYASRQFGSLNILPLIAAFKKQYPTSSHTAALEEYALAAYLEHGFDALYEAALGEHRRFQSTWTNGLGHLALFLQKLTALSATDYTALRDRSLAADTQLALALLAQDPAAPLQIPTQDSLLQERLRLIELGLHQKFHPDAWEQNLQNYESTRARISALPPSRDRARLLRHLCNLGFLTGERLWAEAAGMPPPDAARALTRRVAAGRYFAAARQAHDQLLRQDWTRTSPIGLAALWMTRLDSYRIEQDQGGLSATVTMLLTNSTPGTANWLVAKFYQGVALAQQSPPQLEAATAAFDEVLTSTFADEKNRDFHEQLVLYAARWRVQLAYQSNDPTAALEVLEHIQHRASPTDAREKFLLDHAWVSAWAGVAPTQTR